MTPNSLPTSTGEPTLRHTNSDTTFGFNHLLRSVDPRSNQVLYEKLISPNQMGGLTGVSTSYIEEVNVKINKTITYQKKRMKKNSSKKNLGYTHTKVSMPRDATVCKNKINLIAQHYFNSKRVYKKQRTTGEMPHPKPTDLDMTKH